MTTSERLPFRVVDAAYSASLDRLVFLADAPVALYRYDPHRRTSTRVDLAGMPRKVSVSPDGFRAAVLLEADAKRTTVALVDLRQMKATDTFGPERPPWSGIALANDRLFGFEEYGTRVHAVDVGTKQDVETFIRPEIRQGVVAPDGKRVHVLFGDNGLGLGRLDVLPTGEVQLTAMRGPPPMCGGLWLSATEDRAFNGCGAVMRPNSSEPKSWVFDKLVPGLSRVQGLAHLPKLDELALIVAPRRGERINYPVSEDAELRILASADYRTLARGLLPGFRIGDRVVNAHGRAVFAARSGDAFHALIEADGAAGLEHAFAVVTIDRSSDRFALASDSRPPQGWAEAYAPQAATRPRASSWNGVSALTRGEFADIERYRRLGLRPKRELEEDDEAEADAREDAEPLPPLIKAPTFALRGQSWRSESSRPGEVTTGSRYDLVRFAVEQSQFTCAVSVGKPDLLLRMLGQVLRQSTIDSVYLRSMKIWTMRSHGRPVFAWTLGLTQKPLKGETGTIVTGVVDADRAALCAYQGQQQAEVNQFVEVTSRLLDDLVWEGIASHDYEELSVAWATAPDVVLSQVEVVNAGGAKWTYTTSGPVSYVAGMSRAQIRFGETERLGERYFYLVPGEKLTALRDHELVFEGDTSDVLVAASYRGRAPGRSEEMSLLREGKASYRVKRPGTAGSQRFITDQDLVGPVLAATKLRAAAGAGAFQFVLPEFVPEASTSRMVPVTYSRLDGEAADQVTIRTPTVTNRATFGANGRITRVQAKTHTKSAFRLQRAETQGNAQPKRLLTETPKPRPRPAATRRNSL
ncbi:MAG TPA: hypothetical protein VJN18_01685 [Polyangiaceae bacterium]|nr:hypothetical protein [Polyangiaceae bacterium]